MKHNHYTLENNTLTLHVKSTPIFIRVLMFTFSFMLIILPVSGMISYISEGKGMHAGFFVSIFIFGLIGFYMLRVSLWNTYGKEVIVFNENKCTYYTDYNWFKDGLKTEAFNTINFAKNPVGYLEDNNYALVIEDHNAENEILCVTKMQEAELDKLIRDLRVLQNQLSVKTC